MFYGRCNVSTIAQQRFQAALSNQLNLITHRQNQDREYYEDMLHKESKNVFEKFKLIEKLGTRHGKLFRQISSHERIEIIFEWDFEKHFNVKTLNKKKVIALGYGTYYFKVLIIKPMGTLQIFCATLMGDDFIIQDVVYTPSTINKNQNDVYPCRIVSKLSYNLVLNLRKHLNSLGIDENLCRYIATHSDSRAFREEIGWCNNIRRFLV
jgi:hypothetical protein